MTSTGWDWTTRVWSAVLLSGLVSNSILSKDDAVSPIEATSDGIISCCLRPVIYQCSNFASTLQSNEEKRSITNKILCNITVWSTNFYLKKSLSVSTMSITQSWSPNSLAWHLTTHGIWDFFFSWFGLFFCSPSPHEKPTLASFTTLQDCHMNTCYTQLMKFISLFHITLKLFSLIPASASPSNQLS